MAINYNSSPNGYSLTTEAPGLNVSGGGMPTGSGGPDFSLFARLAERRMAEQARQRAAEEARRAASHRAGLDLQNQEASRAAIAFDDSRDANRASQEAGQYREQIARSGPPLKPISGFNMGGGYTQDVNAMNAIQRQMYLPGGSTATLGGLSDTQAIALDPNSREAVEVASEANADAAREEEQRRQNARDDQARRDASRRINTF